MKETLREVARTSWSRRSPRLDDHLTEKYLTDPNSITEDEIRAALRKGTIDFKCHPVFCGSALQVRRRAAAARRRHRLPAEPAGHARRSTGHDLKDPDKDDRAASSTPDEPFCGLAFKIVNDQHGDLTYVRVYSGKLEKGSRVLNGNRQQGRTSAACSRCTPPTASRSTSPRPATSSRASASRKRITGDTLCDQDDPILLERPTFPEPVISMSIEPKTAADKQKLGEALTNAPPRGPDVPGQLRRGNRRDDHRRHGRAAPGDPAACA